MLNFSSISCGFKSSNTIRRLKFSFLQSFLVTTSVIYVTRFGGLFNYQIAGLTNNSYIEEAHEVRHCVQKYKILGKYVLQVAKVIDKLLKCDNCII